MTDFELLTIDRIEKIKSINEQMNLLDNAYLSFSGGKDSTILHYLLDMALPNNNIPRVFINTGIEYNLIYDFVKEISQNDKRFIIIKPTKNIKEMLEKNGYPFKSKEHSLYLSMYQKYGIENKTVQRYLNPSEKRKSFSCPSILRYQFSKDFSIKISNKCCYILKKEPAYKWSIENKKTIKMTGMRKEEGGNRKSLPCISKTRGITSFHPLSVVSEEWEEHFLKENNIKLCKLYYYPYNFKRTGCKGCPYAKDLQEQLTTMSAYFPSERKQCEKIWEPVYKEQRKIEYRLKSIEQLRLF